MLCPNTQYPNFTIRWRYRMKLKLCCNLIISHLDWHTNWGRPGYVGCVTHAGRWPAQSISWRVWAATRALYIRNGNLSFVDMDRRRTVRGPARPQDVWGNQLGTSYQYNWGVPDPLLKIACDSFLGWKPLAPSALIMLHNLTSYACLKRLNLNMHLSAQRAELQRRCVQQTKLPLWWSGVEPLTRPGNGGLEKLKNHRFYMELSRPFSNWSIHNSHGNWLFCGENKK